MCFHAEVPDVLPTTCVCTTRSRRNRHRAVRFQRPLDEGASRAGGGECPSLACKLTPFFQSQACSLPAAVLQGLGAAWRLGCSTSACPAGSPPDQLAGGPAGSRRASWPSRAATARAPPSCRQRPTSCTPPRQAPWTAAGSRVLGFKSSCLQQAAAAALLGVPGAGGAPASDASPLTCLPGALTQPRLRPVPHLQMINLATEYFSELMTNGNAEACHRILSHDVEHKDMVRHSVSVSVQGCLRPALLPGSRM